MRGTRWLLLVAIVAIVSGIGFIYRAEKKAIRAQAPPKPASLPDDVNSTAETWTYRETNASDSIVEISATDALEARDSSRLDLKGVVLKLYKKHSGTYDLIKSAAANYYKGDHRFYSEGQVEITLDEPIEGDPKHQLISIKSSGVNFDTNKGSADTDRPADFTFEHGTGHSDGGASYDPETHELHLKQNVVLNWTPEGPNAKPMKIETDSLYYHEATGEIWLHPWGRLTRENTVVQGDIATVKLQDDGTGHKSIHSIDATNAHGTDAYPRRNLQYSAGGLHVDFNAEGVAEKIVGEGNARLVNTSDAAETTITGRRVEMNFDVKEKESVLSQVLGNGDAVVTEKPLPIKDRELSETHILRSDQLQLKMRPDGREIETVVTEGAGALEFLPNLPIQHHRVLNGNGMVIAYGPGNRIQNFRATGVRTQTEPTADEKKRNRTASVTTSRQMEARFDPKTSKMTFMRQTGDFTYDEGDRKARAATGTLDSDQNILLLDTGARMSDSAGSTTADRIRMDQRTGDFTAEGHVNSSHLPDKDPKKNSQMLNGDEPMHAQARKMDSANHNRRMHYEGNVLMWQGANRIQAETIDLDREKRTLVADGHVVTNLWEEPKEDQKKKGAVPVMTEVHAAHLTYTEEDRLAIYTGGVILDRPNLKEKSREIHAWLSPAEQTNAGATEGSAQSGGDSRLDRAFADGTVEIHQTSQEGITYNSTAEHSEYYTAENKVILTGGVPTMIDSRGNKTIGPGGLTYYANDDRLLINGANGKPANSRLIRKKK